MSYMNENNFIKAVKFIHSHLDSVLVLSDIAKEIGLSVSSLKRLFLEATGVSAGSFIRRLRMERAFRSLQNKEMSILEVALQSGFEDHSAFARCFKDNFGYSPTCARNRLNIVNELECVSLEEPEIIEINEIELQSVTLRGLYFESAPRAWQALKVHLNTSELDDDFVGIFIGIGHDNPHEGHVSEDRVRFSACIALCSRDLSIEKMVMSKGAYAKFIFTGKSNNLGLAYHYIYGKWVEQSQFQIETKIPAFTVFSELPESFKEQRIAIYVPLTGVRNMQ